MLDCQAVSVFPQPRSCAVGNQTNLKLSPTFQFTFGSLRESNDDILQAAVDRYLPIVRTPVVFRHRGSAEPHLGNATILDPIKLPEATLTSLQIHVLDNSERTKTLASNEDYELVIVPSESHLYARTVWGALHGLETFSQLFTPLFGNLYIFRGPMNISDSPRFPWRGLLLDTANHFLQVPTILQIVEGLAANKMNVLHWHIFDSYSFPMQVPTAPLLCSQGAWDPRAIYSVDDITRIVEFSRVRGVRVVPELEAPGHAFSWGLGYPDVVVPCNASGGSDIGDINTHPLDPTKNNTYKLIQSVLSVMTGLFPDAFMHAGGDELSLDCWNNSASIREWMRSHNVSDVTQLYVMFENRFFKMLSEQQKRPVVWDEVFSTIPQALPNNTIVEVWHNVTMVDDILSKGLQVLLADGWYLDRQIPVDHKHSWFWEDTWTHMFGVDPDSRVLGGEAAMWSEQVNDHNVIQRIWPRACGVAERLWSAPNNSVSEAAQRLSVHRCRMAHRNFSVGPVWADFCGADLAPTPPDTGDTRVPQTVLALVFFAACALVLCGVAVRVALAITAIFRPAKNSAETPLLESPRSTSTARTISNGSTDDLKSNERKFSSNSLHEAGLQTVDLNEPLVTPAAEERPRLSLPKAPNVRVESVDVCRGLAVAFMILVDGIGEEFPWVDHSPWDGLALADLVMPCFDFVVGVSVALAFKHAQKNRIEAFEKATIRFFKIFFLGILTQGGVSFMQYDLSRIRIMGILQRVAVCFYVAALCEIFLPKIKECRDTLWGMFARYCWHWAVAFVLLLTHTLIMYTLPVPGCGAGVLTPLCNAQSYVDGLIFGVSHMYFPTNGGGDGAGVTFQRLPACSTCSPGQCGPVDGAPDWCFTAPFDPEGAVSSLTAVIAALVGLHYGHILQLPSVKARVRHWVLPALLQLVLGLALHYSRAVPMNTDLYSVSFLFVTNACSGLLLCAAYLVVDVVQPSVAVVLTPFRWLGLNAITAYLIIEGDVLDSFFGCFWWDNPDNSLKNIFWPTGVFWGPSDPWPDQPGHNIAVLFWALGNIAIAVCITGLLHKHHIYLKL